MVLISCCTCWIGTFVMCFFYNKFYLKDLINDHGFKPASEADHKILLQKRIMFQ